MITLDTCHALECDEFVDPRYSIHGPGGEPVEACEPHGNPGCDGRPCTCPQHDGRVGDVPAMQRTGTQEREGQVTVAEIDERAKHASWLRDDVSRLEALIATMPDAMHYSRATLEKQINEHRVELRQLVGISVPEKKP